MSNCRFPDSFTVASECMKALRDNNNEAPDFNAAWYDAQRLLAEMYPAEPELKPQTTVSRAPEYQTKPRTICLDHREKSFTFSDGSVWRCCTHDECEWGKSRKTHSDGSKFAPEYSAFDIPRVEITDDGECVVEVAELTLSSVKQVPIAGEDEPESITEDEITPEEEDLYEGRD
jgi:hypothetical protein